MTSFDIGASRPVGAAPVTPVQPVGAVAPATDMPATDTAAAVSSAAAVHSSVAAAAASAPVDHERVAAIRKAVATGTYPLTPARITDALIAAGMMLQRNR